ncbi:MAG TPA: BON domain-containing protein [Candidatus Polarisedimenticolia bacterium]|jgi:osmotically-inducible protein OsmY|nr:BON domain-containing protein [Candidatus Polarisedimenticolia bacterium]
MREPRTIAVVGLALVAFLAVGCTQTTDATITGMIKTKLAADGRVRASEINVDTTKGVVTLTGNVDGQEARDAAIKLARDTSGVSDVKDMISVRSGAMSGEAPDPNLSLGERVDDAGITMRVKARLLDDPLVKGLQIDVDTRDTVVFLTGSVGSEAERKQAIEIARSTEGVTDVQANLR